MWRIKSGTDVFYVVRAIGRFWKRLALIIAVKAVWHWPHYVSHIYIDELARLLKNHGVEAKLFADDVKV